MPKEEEIKEKEEAVKLVNALLESLNHKDRSQPNHSVIKFLNSVSNFLSQPSQDNWGQLQKSTGICIRAIDTYFHKAYTFINKEGERNYKTYKDGNVNISLDFLSLMIKLQQLVSNEDFKQYICRIIYNQLSFVEAGWITLSYGGIDKLYDRMKLYLYQPTDYFIKFKSLSEPRENLLSIQNIIARDKFLLLAKVRNFDRDNSIVTESDINDDFKKIMSTLDGIKEIYTDSKYLTTINRKTSLLAELVQGILEVSKEVKKDKTKAICKKIIDFIHNKYQLDPSIIAESKEKSLRLLQELINSLDSKLTHKTRPLNQLVTHLKEYNLEIDHHTPEKYNGIIILKDMLNATSLTLVELYHLSFKNDYQYKDCRIILEEHTSLLIEEINKCNIHPGLDTQVTQNIIEYQQSNGLVIISSSLKDTPKVFQTQEGEKKEKKENEITYN